MASPQIWIHVNSTSSQRSRPSPTPTLTHISRCLSEILSYTLNWTDVEMCTILKHQWAAVSRCEDEDEAWTLPACYRSDLCRSQATEQGSRNQEQAAAHFLWWLQVGLWPWCGHAKPGPAFGRRSQGQIHHPPNADHDRPVTLHDHHW